MIYLPCDLTPLITVIMENYKLSFRQMASDWWPPIHCRQFLSSYNVWQSLDQFLPTILALVLFDVRLYLSNLRQSCPKRIDSGNRSRMMIPEGDVYQMIRIKFKFISLWTYEGLLVLYSLVAFEQQHTTSLHSLLTSSVLHQLPNSCLVREHQNTKKLPGFFGIEFYP